MIVVLTRAAQLPELSKVELSSLNISFLSKMKHSD